MLLAAIAIGVVIVALLWDLLLPPMRESFERYRARRAIVPNTAYDPGRERRAEQRARELLRSCVNDEEWSMYRDLGFIRVWGAMAQAPKRPGAAAQDPRTGAPYAYLGYPHKPIVAYPPQTRGRAGPSPGERPPLPLPCSTPKSRSSPTCRRPASC